MPEKNVNRTFYKRFFWWTYNNTQSMDSTFYVVTSLVWNPPVNPVSFSVSFRVNENYFNNFVVREEEG